MSDKNVELFCDKVKSMLGASECMSFSGRLESIVALFDAIQLGERDCVYLSPLVSSEVVKAILACGVVPVFCDVVPDSLTLDYKMLENSVRHTISNEDLYPRAVIADNFSGMSFASKAVKNVCDRMGLILIEDCGECFGGVSDNMLCGSVGDYSLISLGSSSVFGTGGSGSLLTASEGNELSENIVSSECGSGYQSVDEIYGKALVDSLKNIDSVLDKSRKAAADIEKALTNSSFWLQRGGSKQKSSFGKITIIAQEEEQCHSALNAFEASGLLQYVKPVHVHRRSCFSYGCRGFKDIDNASAIAPRAFSADIFGAIHNAEIDKLIELIVSIAMQNS